MLVLDATAGPRGIWFDKNDESTIYLDLRREVRPDIVASGKDLPFRDSVFDMIVFDPPHVAMGPNSIMAKQYGRFNTEEIRDLLRKGSSEFSRVGKAEALLLFKWNDHDQALDKVLQLMPCFKPMFGQKVSYRTKHSATTYWVCLRRLEKPIKQVLTPFLYA